MIKKLRLRISLIVFAAFFLVTAAIVGALNYKMNSQLIRSAHQMLSMLADNDGKLPSAPSGDYDLGFGSQLNIETQYSTRYFYVVLDKSGTITSNNLDHIAAVSEDNVLDYVQKALAGSSDEGWASYFRYLKVTSSDHMTIYYVDCYYQRSYVDYLTKLSLIIGGFGMLFACIFVYIFSGRAIKPMEESFQKQKRFITDASHELKTPLAAISANVDVLELQSGENDTTHRIKNQVTHLSSLINEMLTLSRMTSTKLVSEEVEDIALSTLVMEKSDEFIPVTQTQQKKLQCNIQENVHLQGNPKDIDRLVSVLLDNAVKYCLPNGLIQVTLSCDRRSVHFAVTNSSDPIRSDELSHLFDRFYRTDHSRSRDTGSFGIGLSIADAIVEKHHGKITAKNVSDGVRFEFELPAKASVSTR